MITLSLGIWQLKRLDWKNSLIKKFSDSESSKPINLNEASIREFIKIKAVGTINRNKKIFFPSKTLDGKVGMRLASELTLDNGKKYLIDEGWFENSYYNYFKDNNDIFNVNILGYIRFPRESKFFTPQNNLQKNEWYTYDLVNIKNFFSLPLNQVFFIKKTNPNKEDFLISSNLEHKFINNHLQYAITWFCMSLAFIILFLVYLKKYKNE